MSDIKFIVKWNGSEYIVDELCPSDSVLDLKCSIFKQTRVRPERQKLMGLKYQGKPPNDHVQLSELKLKPNAKIMMMGSLETEIQNVMTKPTDIPEVINDLDIDANDVEIPPAEREEYLKKVERRVKDYKVNVLNEFRSGKKLLVLDIDYTLFDHRSCAESASLLMRPFLHEFLTSAYEDYDIVIWSATGMKWIEVKMRELGVTSNTNYKISFYLDYEAMISVHTPKYGVVEVKPLGVIWGKFQEYSHKNTIMFDDIRRNFIMNPQNGLRIKAFREAHFNRDKDRELLKLAKYLKDISSLPDLSNLNHGHWERFKKSS